jgi:hypothetical protein
MSKTLRDLREEMNDEQVKNILEQFNVQPYEENGAFIVFPTCCHNLEGGSPKLYYYKNTKLFHCYTECCESFDIFHLLVKMMKLRGKDITLHEAVILCDLDSDEQIDYNKSEQDDYQYMMQLERTVSADKLPPLETYDKNLLKRYVFDINGLTPWINEGISLQSMKQFDIRYDPIQNCIVIPNYDENGNLIGVRGRFLNPEDIEKGKYRPLCYNNICLKHPTGRVLYGFYQNQDNIRKKKTVIIFEGEKSVLHYNDYYQDNIAVATLGKNITQSHINLLLRCGVTRVVLAYDADYETEEELANKQEEYTKLAHILTPYFNVSVLLDWDLQLSYKSSPIEGGKEYFEKLLRQRLIL